MANANSNTENHETDSNLPSQQSGQPVPTANSQSGGQFVVPCSTVCITAERLAGVIDAYSQSIHDDNAASNPPQAPSDNRENGSWRAFFDAEFRESHVRIMANFIIPNLDPQLYKHRRVVTYFEALRRLESSILTTVPSLKAYYSLLFRVCREIRKDHGEDDQN